MMAEQTEVKETAEVKETRVEKRLFVVVFKEDEALTFDSPDKSEIVQYLTEAVDKVLKGEIRALYLRTEREGEKP